MDKVSQSITDVERKMGKINAIMAKGASKMSMSDMITQARKGNSIESTIKKGMKSAEGVTTTEAEIKTLLVQISKIVELEEKQMSFVIESKSHFDKIHSSGMVKSNLEKGSGSGSTTDIAKTLAEKNAPALLPEIEELQKREEVALRRCLDVYTGATGGEDIDDDEKDGEDSD